VDELITNGTATLYNYLPPVAVRGRYVAADPEDNPEDETWPASCQPDKGANYTAFAETGNRSKFYVKLFLPPDATVRPESHVGSEAATRFEHTTFPDVVFRVLSVESWVTDDPAHLLARAVREDEAPR
jgi:hypothetical protein